MNAFLFYVVDTHNVQWILTCKKYLLIKIWNISYFLNAFNMVALQLDDAVIT